MRNIFSGPKEIIIAPRTIVFAVFLVLGLIFLYQIRSILVLFFLSFILMVALSPLVGLLRNKVGLGRRVSTVLAYLIFFTTVCGLFLFIIPPLATQVQPLVDQINFPLLQDDLKNLNLTLQEWDTILSRFGQSAGLIFAIINTAFYAVFVTVTFFILSFWLSLERDKLHEKVGWFTKDQAHFQKARDFLNSIEKQLGGWVRGEATLMLIIGVITYIGLSLLAIPYALPLALLAGMLEIIPSLGPTLAIIPAVTVAFLFYGPVMALVVLAFTLGLQQFENSFLIPKVMQKNAHVNPLIAILLIIIGYTLGDILGALLAIPTYIVLRTTYWFFLQPRLVD